MIHPRIDEGGGPASEMTLRDWFAGQALQGIFASSNHRDAWLDGDIIREKAYEYADHMLIERAKDDETETTERWSEDRKDET